MIKRNRTKDKQLHNKILHRKQKTAKQTPLKTGGEVVCSGRVGGFCSTSGIRRITV
jgi:hypothetical protein